MKRYKLILILCVSVIVITAAVVWAVRYYNLSGSYPAEATETAYAVGARCVADNAVITGKWVNGSSVITITEFVTGQEMVLCALPACKHSDESCFAYTLSNGGADGIILSGDSLYYTVRLYEAGKAKPCVLEFRKSSVDGSHTKVVGRIERDDQFILMNEAWLREGFIAMTFYMNNTDGGRDPEIPVTFQIALISTYDDSFFLLPEHTGYNSHTRVLAVTDGRLYYEHSYYTVPVDYSKSDDIDYLLSVWSQVRSSIYMTELSAPEEKVYAERYNDIAAWHNQQMVVFIGAPEGLITGTPLPGYKIRYTLQPWDLTQPEQVLTIPPHYQLINTGPDCCLFSARDEAGEYTDYQLYDPADDALYPVFGTPLMDYSISDVLSDKLLMRKWADHANYVEDETILYWIAIDDVKNGRWDRIQEVTLLM